MLQSARVMHMSRPQWRRKKQLMSTRASSSSSAPRPRPTTVPSPRPLNRDSAEEEEEGVGDAIKGEGGMDGVRKREKERETVSKST